ncbi:hypothetical protein DENSPDRAFT_930795 [Dentipellis sp. KUC8613]|nr:hypothetical protein DENSPDRAFT_930795 [Dentipellis sp. KUC8613]
MGPHPFRLRESEALFNTNHVALVSLVAAPAPAVPSPPPPQTTHARYAQARILSCTPQRKTPGAVSTTPSSCRPVQQTARPACARARAPPDETTHWRREVDGGLVSTPNPSQSLAVAPPPHRCPVATCQPAALVAPPPSVARIAPAALIVRAADAHCLTSGTRQHLPRAASARVHRLAVDAPGYAATSGVRRCLPHPASTRDPPPVSAPAPLPPRCPLRVAPVAPALATTAVCNAPTHTASRQPRACHLSHALRQCQRSPVALRARHPSHPPPPLALSARPHRSRPRRLHPRPSRPRLSRPCPSRPRPSCHASQWPCKRVRRALAYLPPAPFARTSHHTRPPSRMSRHTRAPCQLRQRQRARRTPAPVAPAAHAAHVCPTLAPRVCQHHAPAPLGAPASAPAAHADAPAPIPSFGPSTSTIAMPVSLPDTPSSTHSTSSSPSC